MYWLFICKLNCLLKLIYTQTNALRDHPDLEYLKKYSVPVTGPAWTRGG